MVNRVTILLLILALVCVWFEKETTIIEHKQQTQCMSLTGAMLNASYTGYGFLATSIDNPTGNVLSFYIKPDRQWKILETIDKGWNDTEMKTCTYRHGTNWRFSNE